MLWISLAVGDKSKKQKGDSMDTVDGSDMSRKISQGKTYRQVLLRMIPVTKT